jgi:hypothetical protein
VDGRLYTTLKGEHIVQEFLGILEEYVARNYPATPPADARDAAAASVIP